MRDQLIPLGITKVSAGVSTAPGGYHDDASGEQGQFEVADRRTVKEMSDAIRRAGLEPIYESPALTDSSVCY